ncbi:MAG: flagellin, partial [Lachnospiraceae bacterium]|nr:flagellin [Lachnospiraceae bacterium]
VASTTQFNTQNLLDGTFSGKNLQVGSLSGQKIELSINAMNTEALGLTGATSTSDAASVSAADIFKNHKNDKMGSTTKPADLKVSSFSAAGTTMKLVQRAIDVVSTQRATLGAVQNRLEHTIANLDNISENTQSAESRIRDTDMAKEMVTYSKNNILQQAGQSMLAQANQSNQGVLSLLQ